MDVFVECELSWSAKPRSVGTKMKLEAFNSIEVGRKVEH